ncbi:uncharacterized protein [Palaemon carinicauda]|uniref:uncharacterized protein n=1 Tax=Palaemon carinicauda TaxID=392227 RepID=UPI0035B68DFA
MGRYGYGSGAFAVRAKAKKKRRSSIVSDHVYVNYEKYNAFQKLMAKRKSSRDSNHSDPGIVEEESNEPNEEGLIPGQIPSTVQEQEVVESKSLVVPSEDIVPGPSWWPGPPLQQGGVVRPPTPVTSNGTVSNSLSQVFSGFTEGPWLEIQAKLMPEAEKALKYGQRLFYDEEVGSWWSGGSLKT